MDKRWKDFNVQTRSRPRPSNYLVGCERTNNLESTQIQTPKHSYSIQFSIRLRLQDTIKKQWQTPRVVLFRNSDLNYF